MKNLWNGIRSFFLALAVWLFLPGWANAQFLFTTNNGAITITGYSSPLYGEVTIPDEINGLPVTVLGQGSFSGHQLLNNVTIGTNIIGIGNAAFLGCGLTNLTIPDNVRSIGTNAFANCGFLTNVVIGSGITNIENGTFWQCQKLGSLTIANGVTSIGDGWFQGCAGLKNVTIPESVTNIGNGAFEACDLATVDISTNVISIGNGAFQNCPLVELTIPNSISNIGAQTFQGGAFTNLTIPDSVTNLGDEVFMNCRNLTNVTIPASVVTIGTNAFFRCSRLTTITVDPQNLFFSSVNGVLFDKNETKVIVFPADRGGDYIVPNSVTNIGPATFYGCTNLTSVTLPETITDIGSEAFYQCTLLTTLPISDSVTNIGDGAFEYCRSLTSFRIGDSVNTIGNEAFAACSLTSPNSVVIPSRVTSIGAAAFSGFSNVTNIVIGAGVTNIGGEAFQNNWLISISVDPQNPVFSSVNGVLFDKTLRTLVAFPGGRSGNYSVPAGVTTIGGGAIANCSLTNLTIPASVTSIEDEALSSYGLTNVYFQGNAPALGSYVFGLGSDLVFYLPGTTGWSNSFGGLPTASWVLPYPVILAKSVNLGNHSGGFDFTISWSTNSAVVIEGSTNLTASAWLPISTNILVSGTNYFSDPQWTNYPDRFYRVRTP